MMEVLQARTFACLGGRVSYTLSYSRGNTNGDVSRRITHSSSNDAGSGCFTHSSAGGSDSRSSFTYNCGSSDSN